MAQKMRIAILGGGPSGLFLFKRLLESGRRDFTVDIFEAKKHLGYGMPYSHEGANREHITNVSGNEIPAMVTPVKEWITTLSEEKLGKYNIDPVTFHEFVVLPRLLFGEYLNTQVNLLLEKSEQAGFSTRVHLESKVTDVIDVPEKNNTIIEINKKETFEFDRVCVCTGHYWPSTHEGRVAGYFDSPYPPSKLEVHLDHKIAITGSSLTAIDAIRTLARCHGTFVNEERHKLSYRLNDNSQNFKIVMHSRHGLLPGIRFHLDDPHLSKKSLLSKEEIGAHMKQNDGFLSLDFIFQKDFKDSFRAKDPSFYDRIKDMSLEEFVDAMMSMRERVDPFIFFKAEYAEAAQSIRRHESVYWKEMLAVLSFAMNYPAKHFSAEDMRRLQHVLMPLIAIVIAFVPQRSCEEMIALHDSGLLELVSVGAESRVEPHEEGGIVYHYIDDSGASHDTPYKTYINCTGQPHLNLRDFPFKTLVKHGTVSAARLKFRSLEEAKALLNAGEREVEEGSDNTFYLKVPGIAITDTFRVAGLNGISNPRLYVMAVPYIGGFNPDYSGLDFCEEASKIIVNDILRYHEQKN
jgi:uncharacterized NAD(P)/FAD-binding protein YdhS